MTAGEGCGWVVDVEGVVVVAEAGVLEDCKGDKCEDAVDGPCEGKVATDEGAELLDDVELERCSDIEGSLAIIRGVEGSRSGAGELRAWSSGEELLPRSREEAFLREC